MAEVCERPVLQVPGREHDALHRRTCARVPLLSAAARSGRDDPLRVHSSAGRDRREAHRGEGEQNEAPSARSRHVPERILVYFCFLL